MTKILRIARLELSILFYSPVAWLLLVIFTIQAGLNFMDALGKLEASQQLGNVPTSLTQEIFAGNRGFFAAMQKHLYLYIPLLTMGLMSRETSSGSIKLLLSSPVTVRQIVFGKYLSVLVYGLLLIAILFIFIGVAAGAIEHLDFAYIMGALFGMYLLLAAYSAIGLYLSSLTNYQVVAAISTLALLGALSYIGEVGKGIEVVRDITYWFSMEGRTGYALRGLLSSKDIIYFLLVIFLFITLTVMKLNAGRIVRSTPVNALRYTLLVAIIVAVGYSSSRPGSSRYKDVTRYHTQSLAQQSSELIAQVKGPVKLTTYVNLLANLAHIGSPKFRNFDLSNFEQTRRYLPQLQMEYVYFYDTITTRLDPNLSIREQAMRRATAYGFDFTKVLSPEAVRKQVDLSAEQNQFVRILEYNGKKTPLRMFHDMEAYPKEAEIIAAFKRLLGQPLRVGMLRGNEERGIYREGDKDYQALTTALNTRLAWINQGAALVELPVDSLLRYTDSLDLLIIADPIVPYQPAQLEHIRQYIARGGNLLLAGEPNRQRILDPITRSFGVSFAAGTLLQESKDFELDLIQARFARELDGSGFRKTRDTIITMPGAAGLNYSDTAGFKIVPILLTDKRYAWNRSTPFNLKTEQIGFDPAVDKKIQATIAVAVTRQLPEREQRIFVAGDADFLSKGELMRNNMQVGNFGLATQLLQWFSGGEYPPDTKRPDPIDRRIRVSKEQIGSMRTATVFVLPALLAAWGALTIIRRKRK